MKTILAWLDDRTGYKQFLHEALYERVPGGARWRYVWGSTLVFTFAVQVITGIFLWTAYSPSAQTAWESVYYIQEYMTLGSLVRGIHHYAASAMVVLLAFHLVQVVIDGAYRAPREVNFWLGLILMQIVLGLALTGYLLPWDQKGYYATKVATKIMGATPLIGPKLQQLVQGGPEYGHHTLTRFFAMHAGILPALLVAFLALHIWVFRRHGVTVPNLKYAPDTTFWPDQVLKDGIACLAVLAAVMGLAIWRGAELNAPANPAESFSAARPEWYFLFLFQFLRFEWVEDITHGPAFGAIYAPGIIMLIIVLMPFIGRTEKGHKFNVYFTYVLMIGVVTLTTWAFVVDMKDADHTAALKAAEHDAHRVKELAKRPSRIPVDGAITLLKNDPFTQGPKLFAKHCSSCHRYNGHDGTGKLVTEVIEIDGEKKTVPVIPTAVDLGNLGSRDWYRSLLLNYSKHFAPLKNAGWYKTHQEQVAEFQSLKKEFDEIKAAGMPKSGLGDLSRKIITLGRNVRRDSLSQELATQKQTLNQLRYELNEAQNVAPLFDVTAEKIKAREKGIKEQEQKIAATETSLTQEPEELKAPVDTIAGVQKQVDNVEQLLNGVAMLNPQSSDMAGWSREHREWLSKNENDLKALIEYLLSVRWPKTEGSDEDYATRRQAMQIDEKLAAMGQEYFFSGKSETIRNKKGEDEEVTRIQACTDCHDSSRRGRFARTSAEPSAPDLTGLYSDAWLKDFVSHPARWQHYGTRNQMPGFANRLSEKELDLLVRWLMGVYYKTSLEQPPSRVKELADGLKERPDYKPPTEKSQSKKSG